MISIFILIGIFSQTAYGVNSPPTINLLRHWPLTEDEPIGSVVTRIKYHDEDGDHVNISLGRPSSRSFGSNIDGSSYFYIDNDLRVKLNRSLEGMAGKSFLVGVIATDGYVPNRVDVLVEIRHPNEPARTTPSGLSSAFDPGPPPPIQHLPKITFSGGPGPPLLHLSPNTLWHVSADAPIGTLVYVIEANDLSRTFLRFSIHPSDLVKVDEVSGEVSVKEDLSDKIGSYPITVNVSDKYSSISEVAMLRISEGGPDVTSVEGDDDEFGFPTIFIQDPFRPEVKKRKPVQKTKVEKETTDNDLIVISPGPPELVHEKQIGWTVVILILALGVVPLCLVSLFLVLRWKKRRKPKTEVKESVVSYCGKRSSSVLITEGGSSVLNGIFNMVGIHKRAESNSYSEDSGKPAVPSRSVLKREEGEEGIDQWEVSRHKLRVMGILGEGCFGQVWKYEATNLYEIAQKDSNDKPVATKTLVAVKTLKESASEVDRKDLLQELKVLKGLGSHPNVVALLGCCTQKEPIFIILEYMIGGKLQSYLRSSRAGRSYDNLHGVSATLSPKDLTIFALQIAKGMDFLSKRGIIHRDLAARNILVGQDKTCKVADFGFARDVSNERVYERKSDGRLPIRWMAPESLFDNIFQTKSDVWSFGILLWEIVTLGATPYPGHSAADVMKKVKDGYRLEKPNHCRREVYNIMYYCWDAEQDERPSFSEIVRTLEKLILTEVDYIQLDNFPDHEYYNVISESGELL